MKIRVEEQSDHQITEKLTRQAFWNLYRPGADQHYILHQLRKSSDFIPQLCLVAITPQPENKIIGHIVYSHSAIIYKDGTTKKTITFGPVSVSPEKQGQKIGSELIGYSLKKARDMGFGAVVILGYPSYYHRFGFKNSREFGVKSADGKYYLCMMALQLVEGYLTAPEGQDQKQGIFKQSQFYTTIKEEDVQEFDKKFTPKQKFKTKSQEMFSLYCGKLWNHGEESVNFNVKDLCNREKLE